MNKKFWISTATRPDGTPVVLYLCTTADLITHDLRQAERGNFSLTLEGRRKNASSKKVDDFYSFAIAAFAGHCGSRKHWSGEVKELEKAPEGCDNLVTGMVVERIAEHSVV